MQFIPESGNLAGWRASLVEKVCESARRWQKRFRIDSTEPVHNISVLQTVTVMRMRVTMCFLHTGIAHCNIQKLGEACYLPVHVLTMMMLMIGSSVNTAFKFVKQQIYNFDTDKLMSLVIGDLDCKKLEIWLQIRFR